MLFTKTVFAILGLGAVAIALPVEQTTTNIQDACDRNAVGGYDYRLCEQARADKQHDRDRLDRDSYKLSDARDQLHRDEALGAPYGVIQADRDRLNRDKDKINRDQWNLQGDRARQCSTMVPRPSFCY